MQNLQPDLSGNPFLWLEKPRQKDWERKAEIAATIIKLHILHLLRNVVKRWMTVNFILRRFVKCFGIVGICGVDMLGFYDPNADALHPSGVNIACVLDCHISICSVETADVLVVEALSASDENLPKWPFCILHNISDQRRIDQR